MKKHLIIIEKDDVEEIDNIRQILTNNSIEFAYYPSIENAVVEETKSFYQSLLDKLKWKKG